MAISCLCTLVMIFALFGHDICIIRNCVCFSLSLFVLFSFLLFVILYVVVVLFSMQIDSAVEQDLKTISVRCIEN